MMPVLPGWPSKLSTSNVTILPGSNASSSAADAACCSHLETVDRPMPASTALLSRENVSRRRMAGKAVVLVLLLYVCVCGGGCRVNVEVDADADADDSCRRLLVEEGTKPCVCSVMSHAQSIMA
eukprot:scaffold482_cov266-Amphora_coffeaeformis.AAC.2